MRPQRLRVFLGVILFLVPSMLFAGEWLYSGNALPTSSGWHVPGSPSNCYENGLGIESKIVSGGGSNTWRMYDYSGSNRGLVKNTVLGNIGYDTGATLAANVRCRSHSSDSSYNLGITNGGVGAMFLCIKSDRCYLVQSDGAIRGSVYTFASDTTGYHRYYLRAKNSSPGSNASCKWIVYRDGLPVITYVGLGGDVGGDGFFAGHGGTSGTGIWYFDWIAATNNGGYSPAQWNPMPTGLEQPPAAPSISYPVSGSTLAGATTILQWSSDLHDLYEVRIATTDSSEGTIAWTSGEVTSEADSCATGALDNGVYYAYVRAHNLVGWGPWSASGHTFTINYQSPPAPSAPVIAVPETDSTLVIRAPVIQWAGDAHDTYEVHINTTNLPEDGSVWDSGEVSSSADSCDAGVLANGTYYAFARVHNDSGWGQWSAEGHSFQINYQGKTYKQGWVMLRDDQAYNLDLLSKAREYHINHVQLSHDIMMYVHEPMNDASRRARINELTDAAHANGVAEVVVWTHEIQWRDMPPGRFMVGGKVNLNDPAFWAWLYWEYDRFFKDYCPHVDGLVLTLTENWWPGEGCDFINRLYTTHTDPITGVELPRSESVRKAVETIYNACKENNKSLYVRDWTLFGGSDRYIRDAVKACDPEIWLMSKGVGAGDWNCMQEYYDIIGTCTGHPELVELDIIGEYWGLGATPCAAVDYLKDLWNFHLPKGVGGMVARIDRGAAQAYSGPNRVNMYAIDALASCPGIDEDSIYKYWSAHWFGPSIGDRVSSALKRTRDITSSCNNLPLVYPFSRDVARDYVLRSLFDLDYVGVALKSAGNFQPGSGLTNYEVLSNPMLTAAGMLNVSLTPTLFGDFSPAYSDQITITCEAAVVDATYGLIPNSFKVEYSTDGGGVWVNYTDFTVTPIGSAVEPYRIRANSVPFGPRAAGNNKVRFTATNLASRTESKIFTIRGLDQAHVSLGSSVVSDGLSILPLGDGNWTLTTAGGRQCAAPASANDVAFYFKADEGFAYDRSPQTLYLQVEYYGASGFIKPYYDSVWMSDEPLEPVYLSGGTTWRTVTWKIDNVNFGHRLNNSVDFNLYFGPSSPVRIAAVRLYYAEPQGALDPPTTAARAVSESQIEVTWDPVAGATKYRVCRDGTLAAWSTGASFTDSGLSPNTQYTYTVTAFDASGMTSCVSNCPYATTYSRPPLAPSTVSCNIAAGVWQTSSQFQFTAVGGFKAGKVAYYQYVWDEWPARSWSGSESTWPAVSAPSGTQWTVWRPLTSPTDNVSGWVLYDGSTTQRTMSEELLTEKGIPTWKLSDQGRIWNSNAKIAASPNVSIDRDVGATLVVRIKAADSRLGWWNSGMNFGFNLSDCPDIGVIVRPDYIHLEGPNAGTGQNVDNGYSYHTYVLTLKNSTPGNNSTTVCTLYRDGQSTLSLTQGATSWQSEYVGPWFGHFNNDALGAWYFQWIAYRTDGAFEPSPGSGVLTMTAPYQNRGYYLHLKGFNADDSPNGTLDLGPYYYWDGFTVAAPTVTDDGAYTTSDAIHVKWSPSAPPASYYEYAIGSSPGLQDIVPFTNVGLSLETTRTGLSLTEGQTYYVAVRATVGATTLTGSSDGITVAPRLEKIADAKVLADGAPVALYGKTVTAVFSDCAYVQDPYGMGIRIVTSRPVTAGDVVDLAGTTAGSDTERRIEADTVIPKGTGAVEAPCLTTQALGGSGYYRQGSPSGQKATKSYRWILDKNGNGTRSSTVLDVPGASNVGLLVRVFGRTSSAGVNSFYINDGSRCDDYYDTTKDGPPGVKVVLPNAVTPPSEGTFVGITGICSTYESGGVLYRQMRVRNAGDIQRL